MRVITVHKILIGTAAAFFLFFAGREIAQFIRAGEAWALPRGIVALLVAVALGAYFGYLCRKGTLADVADGLRKPRP